MKFSENSLVVDVIKISNSSYKLSVPAGDLLTAAMNGAVLRRHDLSTAAVPNILYVPLSEAKLSSGTYTFTFASGDAFTASSADAYPAASSVSDKTDSELPAITPADAGKVLTANDSGVWVAQNPSSGGGVLVVNGTWNDLETECTLDKTWQEIHDGGFGVVKTTAGGDTDIVYMPIIAVYVDFGGSSYGVVTIQEFDEYMQGARFIASSASGYPVLSLS